MAGARRAPGTSYGQPFRGPHLTRLRFPTLEPDRRGQGHLDALGTQALDEALAQLVLHVELVEEARDPADQREVKRVLAEAGDQTRCRRRVGEQAVDLARRPPGRL
jgi:hypothetical protein